MEKKRELAIQLIKEFNSAKPQFVFQKLNEFEKGAFFVLNYLAQQTDEVISVNLSNALNVSTARMAKLLSKMEAKGLINKNTSLTDSRKTVVTLTEYGNNLITMHNEALIKAAMKMIDLIGEEDLKEFIRISLRIKNASIVDDALIDELKNQKFNKKEELKE